MGPMLSGVTVGALVFLLLLLMFAQVTGPVELVLWAGLGVAAGWGTMHLLRRRA